MSGGLRKNLIGGRAKPFRGKGLGAALVLVAPPDIPQIRKRGVHLTKNEQIVYKQSNGLF